MVEAVSTVLSILNLEQWAEVSRGPVVVESGSLHKSRLSNFCTAILALSQVDFESHGWILSWCPKVYSIICTYRLHVSHYAIGCMLPTASSADWTSCTIFISSVCPIQRNYGATRFPDVSCFQPDCSGMPCSHRTDFKGAEAGSTTRSSHVQSEVLMQIFKRRHNYEQWWLVKSIWRTTPGARPVG
jgi:hypothetical protein